MTPHQLSTQFLTILLHVGLFAGSVARPTQAFEPEPETLFDGQTLKGWDFDPNYWSVQDGAIVGTIPAGSRLDHNTWIVWKGGELEDFDLRMQVKLSGAPAANSGIQIRCQAKDVNHVSGYQADLDMGATWLGRIYDEHGRALLVERGHRVRITTDGHRSTQNFAPAPMFATIFRAGEWNDYRIVGIGERIAVFINGTLFAELIDQEAGERDLAGHLAMQLHSGPETRVEFRNIRLEHLSPEDTRLGDVVEFAQKPGSDPAVTGLLPENSNGTTLNLDFEDGDLGDWVATGTAFQGQPVNKDSIASRWAGQSSNKQGEFFIGGYELSGSDTAQGTLTSAWFKADHPFASFLIAGGSSRETRVDVLRRERTNGNSTDTIIATASGQNREQMQRVVVDLRPHRGAMIAVRLTDASSGGWGHLNFDDFRLHETQPAFEDSSADPLFHPLLHGLVPNTADANSQQTKLAGDTLERMSVPPGFTASLIAAEPDLHQPMAFTFDARGRLWVVEGHSYPTKRPPGEGLDKVLILEDSDQDGSFESRKVFCEGLNLVSGLQVGFGGVWIGAAPELLFIPDRNQDDIPDSEPQVLLDGFGYADTHETLNSFTWGPDGWLYGNQGVFNQSSVGKPGTAASQRVKLAAGVWRYHPVRQEFEIFAHGGSNQWGLDFDLHGQLFMTHCRSRWGRGPTTHVIQGGHYWNQINAQYASFVSASTVADLPHMRNYLLASARYGHGEGGAGKPGTRALYGGHSHVGTMIYLGDNWPADYRNQLLTHNLHGHRMNRQINVREGDGFNTLHAGNDVLHCSDPQYIGVDLQYGPDGAVYFSDWYDPRHCHNPNMELWQRGNGRMYRLHYGDLQPVPVDYTRASDDELVEAQLHANDWHVRAARLVMAERASRGQRFTPEALARLRTLASEHAEADRRLRAMWCLHVLGQFDSEVARRGLRDSNEFVRAWSIQLMCEADSMPGRNKLLLSHLKRESSSLVKLYFASAANRLDGPTAWKILEALAMQGDIAQERNLPKLLWHVIAQRIIEEQHTPEGLARAAILMTTSKVPTVRDSMWWYLPQVSSESREIVFRNLAHASASEQHRVLPLIASGLSSNRNLATPDSWPQLAEAFYSRPETQASAETIGAAFNDPVLLSRMRDQLLSGETGVNQKRHALAILANNSDQENLAPLLSQIDAPELQMAVIGQLSRYASPIVYETLIARLPKFSEQGQRAAMETLCSRPQSAIALMDAIAAGELDIKLLNGYFARQMASLNSPELTARLESSWGSLTQSSEEKQREIKTLVAAYEEAPLWAYDQNAGARHFQKLCANCHQNSNDTERIGPRLDGSGAKGIEYVVENIVDPNAVVGKDFQARNILTVDGLVVTGIVTSENDTAITVRTATATTVIAQEDIEEIVVSSNSFMPDGLLQTLGEREKIELFKYLMSLR